MRAPKRTLLVVDRPLGLLRRAGLLIIHNARELLGVERLHQPAVDQYLVRLTPLERGAEIIRYSVLRAEYWVSPGGLLRAVLRLCRGCRR